MAPIDNGGIEAFEGEQPELRRPMGIALYKRPTDGAIFAIVSRKTGPSGSYLWQYRLSDDGTGTVQANQGARVRGLPGHQGDRVGGGRRRARLRLLLGRGCGCSQVPGRSRRTRCDPAARPVRNRRVHPGPGGDLDLPDQRRHRLHPGLRPAGQRLPSLPPRGRRREPARPPLHHPREGRHQRERRLRGHQRSLSTLASRPASSWRCPTTGPSSSTRGTTSPTTRWRRRPTECRRSGEHGG